VENAAVSGAAVFLDRDGVLIANVDTYVRSLADVQFLPGVFDALRRLASSAYAVVLVSNQSAVGRGIISAQDALDINAHVVAEVVAQGGRIDASFLCLHSPEDMCSCRKPAPGLLHQAQAELGLDLAASYLVGDAASDIAAARAAGACGILVRTGRGEAQELLLDARDRAHTSIVRDLEAAVDLILAGVADA
jgi:D-glycero-D-manno-heptose 1,7-bisphosphate phosphatase